MTTVPSKHHHQQPLHNFSLPFLKWGHRIQTTTTHHHRRRHHPPTDTSDSDHHHTHRTTTTKHKPHHQNQNDTVSPDPTNLIDVNVSTGDVKPWNLRPRRLVIDTPDNATNGVNGNGNGVSVKVARSVRGAGTGAGVGAGVGEDEKEEEKKDKKMKRRLWISLSKDEIEEDIYAFTGSRPARRPKKRNKIAQKHVDNVFPGLYLVGLSADSYRV